ncbi:spermidine synthase [Arthrobacter sp. TMS2-4]
MAKPAGPRPEIGEFPIDTGTCELEPDPYSPNGWVLRVNGVPSSHIDLDDPLHLDFEYMHWIASLVDARWARSERLRVLHLGGGACSLARRFAASHPHARQVVVELDGRLADLVRTWFDLPRAPLVRIRVGEARAVTESLSEGSRDLVIRDVFAGSVTPAPLTTAEFTRAAKRVLAADGVYLVNCGDSPNLALARREAATIAAEFRHTAIIADPAMLKGRRYGNVIIAGSDAPLADAPGLARELLGGGVPAHLWQDARVRSFAVNAQPFTD